jgi:hypothetical protein
LRITKMKTVRSACCVFTTLSQYRLF